MDGCLFRTLHSVFSLLCETASCVERLHAHQGELLVTLHHMVSSRKSAESWLMWRLRLETILDLRICRSGNLSPSPLLSVSVLGCCSPLQWMSSVSGAPLTCERLLLSEEVGKSPLRSAQHVFLVKQKFLHPHPTSRITPPAPALALGLICPFPARLEWSCASSSLDFLPLALVEWGQGLAVILLYQSQTSRPLPQGLEPCDVIWQCVHLS